MSVALYHNAVHSRSRPVSGQFLDNDIYEEVEVGPEFPETADFGVRISGDSMMPRYLDKQIVWIQKTDELNDKFDPIEIAEGSTFKTFGRVVSWRQIIVHIDCYNIIAPRIRSTKKEGLYGSQK